MGTVHTDAGMITMAQHHGHNHAAAVSLQPGNPFISFVGLLSSGSMLGVLGLFWAYTMPWVYHIGPRTKNGVRATFYSSASFACPSMRTHIVEGAAKMTMALLGIAGTLYLANCDTTIRAYSHVTVFVLYILVGLVDILKARNALPLPDLDYVVLLLTGVGQGLDLSFASPDSNNHLECQLYAQLQLISWAAVASLVAELLNRSSFWCAFSRIACTILQGTWMIEMAFALYGPLKAQIDKTTHGRMMLHSSLMCWHALAVFVLLVCLYDGARRDERSWERKEMEAEPLDDAVIGFLADFNVRSVVGREQWIRASTRAV